MIFNSSRPALIWFLAIAFGFTWVVTIPAALTTHGLLHVRVPLGLQTLAGFAPALAAVVVTALASGREGMKRLFKVIIRGRVLLRWYAFALLVPLATHILAIGAYQILATTAPKVNHWYDWPLSVAVFMPFCLGEEIGWRGFFLDRLMQQFSVLKATIIMAFIWGLWHLPVYLAQSSGHLYIIFLLGIIPASALFGFLYVRTRSVFLCTMLHASLNAGVPFWLASLPDESGLRAFALWTVVLWVAAVPVLVALAKPGENIPMNKNLPNHFPQPTLRSAD